MSDFEFGVVVRVEPDRAIVRLASGRSMPVQYETEPAVEQQVQVDPRARVIVESD